MITPIATVTSDLSDALVLNVYLYQPSPSTGTHDEGCAPAKATLMVTGEVDDISVDVGTHHSGLVIDDLPNDRVAITNLLPKLIDDYHRQLARLVVAFADLNLPDPDSDSDNIPVVLSIDDLELLRRCLSLAQRRWTHDAANARDDAQPMIANTFHAETQHASDLHTYIGDVIDRTERLRQSSLGQEYPR